MATFTQFVITTCSYSIKKHLTTKQASYATSMSLQETRVSYMLLLKLAKQSKAFSDGEFFKRPYNRGKHRSMFNSTIQCVAYHYNCFNTTFWANNNNNKKKKNLIIQHQRSLTDIQRCKMTIIKRKTTFKVPISTLQ